MAISGGLFVARVSGVRNIGLVFPYGYDTGLGLLTLLLALVSLFGVPVMRTTSLVLSGLVLMSGVLITHLPGQASRNQNVIANHHRAAKGFDIWWLVFLGIGFVPLVISFGKGYHTSDEIILWGVKGYGIETDGTLKFVTKCSTNTVPYPLYIPLVIAGIKSLFNEILPASKMVFSGYFVALLIMIYDFLFGSGLRRFVARLCTLIVASTPLVSRHATIGYDNLALSYCLAAVLLIFKHAEPCSEFGFAWLAGIILVGAAWTRPEGNLMAWLCVVVIALSKIRKFHTMTGWKKLFSLVLPLGLYTLFWLWIKAADYTQPLGRTSLASRELGQILGSDLLLTKAL